MNALSKRGELFLKAKSIVDYLFCAVIAFVGIKMVVSENTYFGTILLVLAAVFAIVTATKSALGLRILGCFYLIGSLVVVLFLFPMPGDRSNYSLVQKGLISLVAATFFMSGIVSIAQKVGARPNRE